MTADDTITLSREALRHRLADLYCVALHHEHTGTPECRGTQAADQVIAELLDPPPGPKIGEHIRIIAEGVVTAYDPGSDAVQLDHEECWWPYSDCGTRVSYVVVPDIDLNTVHLPPRTLMHRVVAALDAAGYGIGAATVFSIVAPVFADFLAEQPFTSHDAGQRQYDCVKALRDEV